MGMGKMIYNPNYSVLRSMFRLLSLFDAQDGRCFASESVNVPPLLSHSVVVKETGASYVLWSWNSLHLFEDEEVRCACFICMMTLNH